MDLIYGVSQVMHKIRLKLYKNHLPGTEGTYHARTSSEATLSIDQVCAAKRDRGGFSGNFGEFVNNVKQFFEETAYQIADGFAVNIGYFTIYPNLGGTFATVDERPDPQKHPLTLRIRPHKLMQEVAAHCAVEVEGEADPSGHITEFFDVENGSANHWYEPGNQFVLTGEKIKIAGDDPSCGLYFVPVNPSIKPLKATRIAENGSTKIIGVIPNGDIAECKIEVRTQYSGAINTPLKTVRVISGDFILEHA